MSDRIERLTGDASRRVRGVMLQLQSRRDTALVAADDAGNEMFAASLRGKAAGYKEAILLLRALERGERLRKWHRWMRVLETAGVSRMAESPAGLNPEGGEQ